MKVPKYIIKKSNRAEKLVAEANSLISEIESWMEKHDIDEQTAREEYIFDECFGVSHTISIDALKEYLENQ